MDDSHRMCTFYSNLVGTIVSSMYDVVELLNQRYVSQELFLILIDGPSGSGKTTLARWIQTCWQSMNQDHTYVLHMDDLYQGWGGLSHASLMLAQDLCEPLRLGQRGKFHMWDWSQKTFARQIEVAPGAIVLIEGCGSMSRRSVAVADVALWVEVQDPLRKERAMQVWGQYGYEQHWDFWQQQYEEFCAREHPLQYADMRLDTSFW